MTYREESW